MLLSSLCLQIKGGRDSGSKKRPLPSPKRTGGRGAQRYTLVGGCSAGLQVATKVPVIAAHLASDDDPRDWLKRPRHAAQLAFCQEAHPCPVTVRLERPRSVDWLGPLDDVHVDPHRPVELGELDDLLDLLAARGLRTLPDTRTPPRTSACALLHRRLGLLPLGQLRRVREVIEHNLRRPAHGERLLNAHACLLPFRARLRM